MAEEEKKSVPLGESYDFLKKSMDYLQIQQSSGSSAPILYPEVNQPQDANQSSTADNNTSAQSESNSTSGNSPSE